MIRELMNGHKRILLYFAALLFAAAMFAPHGMFRGTQAAGTISGKAFQDYNGNGLFDNTGGTLANPSAIDAGVQGVTVTAYDSAGVLRGTATTAADGTYSLAAAGTGPYRVEFTNLPAGFLPSGRSNDSVGAGTATNSGSTVFYVPDLNTANVNLGINRAEEYCQNNPSLVMSEFVKGASNGGNSTLEVLVDFPYWAGTVYTDPTPANYDVPGTHALSVRANQLGAVFGLAYARSTRRIYAASYFKKFVGFGPGADGILNNSDDPGAIYVVDPQTSTVATTFTVPNATTNSHDTTNYDTDNGNIGWDAAGKTSLGGIALADDESRLFVMNLQNRTLYALNPTTGAVLASQAVPTANVPTPGGTAANCAAADVRPFAVKYYRQQLYVGMVCSAESTQNNTNLRAYLYQVNPTTLAFGAAPIFQAAMNYTRGFADPGAPAAWRPWFATIVTRATAFSYPQPMVTDIEFDGGNLILALRDRVGDQSNDYDANAKRTAGDTLRACGSFGAWTLESNGRCGGTGTAPQGTGQGPGNGEFYFQDDFSTPANGANYHDDIAWGTTVRIAGSSSVVVSGLDPISRFIDNGATFDGGVRWFNNTSGATDRAYRLYNGSSGTTPDLGKANGLGDVTSMCNVAPIEIGNRVWLDANVNGIQDPGESVLPNVAVQLWADTDGDGTVDRQIGTTTTNANGHYVFGGVGNNNLNSFTCGTTPGSFMSTVLASSDDAEQNLSNNNVSITSNDLELTADGNTLQAVGVRFNNLNIPPGATITNAYIQFIPRATENQGNPTNTIRAQNADNAATFTTANNNIGSRPVTTQSVTWTPGTWNTLGNREQTPNISSLVQAVASRPGWASGNSMAFILSDSAASNYRRAESFDGGGTALAPQLFVTYTTGNLCTVNPSTKYEVRIPATNFNAGQPLNGLVPTGVNTDGTANGVSRDSDGIVLAGSQVQRMFMTGGAGANDHTFDFGFRGGTNIYSVGNRVWFDTNNDGRINAGEVGISGISVSLFVDANSDGIPDTPGTPVGTMVTDVTGYYRFDSLNAGTYVVRVNPSNFAGAAALAGHQNTTGNVVGDVDSDLTNNGENGINPTGAANSIQTNGILSNTITLGPGTSEPLSETDLGATGQGTLDNVADMTVDFGFYCMSLSGTLWNDTGAGPGQNNNGQLDPGETRITNLNVRLFNSAGVEIPVGYDGILGTADDGPTGVFTDGSGNYSFRCLPPGQYRVVVWGSGGTSSTPTSVNPDDNVDNDDNGFPGTGQFGGKTMAGLVTLTPGSTGAMNNNTVSNATGTTANPTVDFGFIVAPTFVKLESFDVYFDGTETVVKWASGAEVDNLGFNVYREVVGKRELINPAPIAGSSLRSSVSLVENGENYQWIDRQALEPGTVYYLEDIDMKGYGTLHGPVSPTLRFSARSLFENPVLLTDLSKVARPSAEREFVGRKPAQSEAAESLAAPIEEVQWQIAASEGVKISVNHDGWYRISADQLRAAGFEPGGKQLYWQLFADGVEVPMEVQTDGSIGFFGRGVDLLTADTRVFYLVKGSAPGMRLTRIDGGVADGYPIAQSFRITTERKDRVAYVSALLNGEKENWFGPFVTRNGPTNQELTVYNPDSAGQGNLRISLQGLTAGNHRVSVRFNDSVLGDVELTDQENRTFDFQLPASALVAGQNRVTLQSFGVGNDISLVDTVALTYSRRYVATGDRLHFGVRAGQSVRVGGFSGEEIDIFEIRGGRADRQVIGSPGDVDGMPGFSLGPVGYDREMIAIERTNTEQAVSVVRNNPSFWNKSANKADLVIITPESLYPQAEQLAKLRKQQGFRTEVVAVEDLYDEFSYGYHSPDAVKRFLEVASTAWKLKPRYAILFGDSSFDPRNYIGQSNRDLVPTKLVDTDFMETASDGWLADFNDDGIEDIALGRLPVSNLDDAGTVVAKLRNYDSQPTRLRESNMLIADRGFESYNDVLRAQINGPVDVSRVERSSLTDSQMREAILSGLNAGPMVVTYTGHGSTGLWASANIFNINDVGSLNNSQMSLHLMMTCLNGYTHNAYGESMAEAMIRRDNGGAVLVWASSGETYPDVQFEMTRIATSYLFNDENHRIGDIVRAAKSATTNQDVRRTWQLTGDPTLFVK